MLQFFIFICHSRSVLFRICTFNIQKVISSLSFLPKKKRNIRNNRFYREIHEVEAPSRALKSPGVRREKDQRKEGLPTPSIPFHWRSGLVVIQDSISLHLHTLEIRVEIKNREGSGKCSIFANSIGEVDTYLFDLNETERMHRHVRVLKRFLKKVSFISEFISELEYYESINDFCRKSIVVTRSWLVGCEGSDTVYGRPGRWIDRLSSCVKEGLKAHSTLIVRRPEP